MWHIISYTPDVLNELAAGDKVCF